MLSYLAILGFDRSGLKKAEASKPKISANDSILSSIKGFKASSLRNAPKNVKSQTSSVESNPMKSDFMTALLNRRKNITGGEHPRVEGIRRNSILSRAVSHYSPSRDDDSDASSNEGWSSDEDL